MSNMFADTEVFNQSLDNFDTSKVTNMDRMFKNADAFNQDLSGWDVSNISSAPSYFGYLPSKNLPIWGTTGSN